MSISDKLTQIAENQQKVFEAGKNAGGGVAVTEIEITSNITNGSEMFNTLFEKVDTTHSYCAVLTKLKNNTLVNNQLIFGFNMTTPRIQNRGVRLRDGVYGDVPFSSNYDIGVTIGDIYTIYDLGEKVW